MTQIFFLCAHASVHTNILDFHKLKLKISLILFFSHFMASNLCNMVFDGFFCLWINTKTFPNFTTTPRTQKEIKNKVIGVGGYGNKAVWTCLLPAYHNQSKPVAQQNTNNSSKDSMHASKPRLKLPILKAILRRTHGSSGILEKSSLVSDSPY